MFKPVIKTVKKTVTKASTLEQIRACDWTTVEIYERDWTTVEIYERDWTTVEIYERDWTTVEIRAREWTGRPSTSYLAMVSLSLYVFGPLPSS